MIYYHSLIDEYITIVAGSTINGRSDSELNGLTGSIQIGLVYDDICFVVEVGRVANPTLHFGRIVAESKLELTVNNHAGEIAPYSLLL